jgi:hypothetical protein
MKKNLLKKYLGLIVGMLLAQASDVNAQTVSTFDDLQLAPGSYWDGSDGSNGFSSGNALFNNHYNQGWGMWEAGFAISNITDNTTAGFGNMYSAFTGSGFQSDVYAVAQQSDFAKQYPVISLTNQAEGKAVNGVYITNSTYAGTSMRDGDGIGKQFGGLTGDDPDWFLLSITGFLNGLPVADTVKFYLADFRFTDNTQDYILDTWEWVDLLSLGNIDSLIFYLSSSDVGAWGMNTPAVFCIDNFTTADSPASVKKSNANELSLNVFPNPAQNFLNISAISGTRINILDITGKNIQDFIMPNNVQNINISDFSSGVYFINAVSLDGMASTFKFIKN